VPALADPPRGVPRARPRGTSTRRWAATALFAISVLCLLWLSIHRSHMLGQYRTMYDNPIYRWRQSVAVALSDLADKPLGGYVAYRSISDYLNQHGLGLMPGEADPLPGDEQLERLIHDPTRLETLFREASRVAIDASLPPVPIVGSEKGEADFYHLAFRLYGISLKGLWLLYFTLLSLATGLYFLAFRRSPFCLLLLMLYLIGHYSVVGYAAIGPYQTVHNSRFLPVLSLLPSLHLLLLVLRRERPSWSGLILASAQAFLLIFVVFCRVQALWQAVAVIATAVLMSLLRSTTRAPQQRPTFVTAFARVVVAAWPAGVVVVGLGGLVAYERLALDHEAYATEARTHVFWHPLYSGTVSASPELRSLYLHDDKPYEDNVVYNAVLSDLRERKDATPAIVEVRDGVIYSFAMKNMGVYDGLVRRVFLHMVRKHPWLVLKSFVYDKPREQVRILFELPLAGLLAFRWALLLTLGAGLLSVFAGLSRPRRQDLVAALWATPLVIVLSLSTTEVLPTTMIVDTVLCFFFVILLAIAYIPSALAWRLWEAPEPPPIARWDEDR
jgi:hypothetical protein